MLAKLVRDGKLPRPRAPSDALNLVIGARSVAEIRERAGRLIWGRGWRRGSAELSIAGARWGGESGVKDPSPSRQGATELIRS